ncbi:MAG: phosphatase PAP2 family protein [Ignavibacteriales bacterium]|nr:phosphatase PAP2 family protein [Ignavibacteriales bacterium]
MIKKLKNRFILIKVIIFSLAVICNVKPMYSQSPEKETTFHPYHVNYWVTGAVIGVGLSANYLGGAWVFQKPEMSLLELQALNKGAINSIDSWALKQDPYSRDAFTNYSNFLLASTVVLPVFLMFDKQIRQDWLDVLLMYVETMSITPNIYEWTPLGVNFQNRVRPLAYYDQLTYGERKSGDNRNSFYSGHTAVVAASTFFMAKVYIDYNPGMGDNKYLLYGAATILPLLEGYYRVKALRHFPSDIIVGIGVGALCGILIPELHRFRDKNISLGLYSSSIATGIAIKWQPDFLK